MHGTRAHTSMCASQLVCLGGLGVACGSKCGGARVANLQGNFGSVTGAGGLVYVSDTGSGIISVEGSTLTNIAAVTVRTASTRVPYSHSLLSTPTYSAVPRRAPRAHAGQLCASATAVLLASEQRVTAREYLSTPLARVGTAAHGEGALAAPRGVRCDACREYPE